MPPMADLAEVRERGAALLRVAHDEFRAGVAHELARVADLAAGFRVERRAIEDDFALVARVRGLLRARRS